MVSWQLTPDTTLRLTLITRENPDGQRTAGSYAYTSSRLFPQFAREVQELGRWARLETIMPLLIAGKNPDSLIGRRIRLTLPVAKLKPLTLGGQKYSVVCQMPDDRQPPGLHPGEIITVSGVIDGLENEAVLRLSQVKVVERPERKER
jgi:hypothetical protein